MDKNCFHNSIFTLIKETQYWKQIQNIISGKMNLHLLKNFPKNVKKTKK